MARGSGYLVRKEAGEVRAWPDSFYHRSLLWAASSSIPQELSKCYLKRNICLSIHFFTSLYVCEFVCTICKCLLEPEEKVHLDCIRGPSWALTGLPRLRLRVSWPWPAFSITARLLASAHFASILTESRLQTCHCFPWPHHSRSVVFNDRGIMKFYSLTSVPCPAPTPSAIGWEAGWAGSASGGNPFLESAEPASLEGHTTKAPLPWSWPCSPSTQIASTPLSKSTVVRQRCQEWRWERPPCIICWSCAAVKYIYLYKT